MAKHRKVVTRKMQLLWTMCCCLLCVVRGWTTSAVRGFHFNTIVRDLFCDCLTKFDCNLITVEWPIVSSFDGGLKGSDEMRRGMDICMVWVLLFCLSSDRLSLAVLTQPFSCSQNLNCSSNGVIDIAKEINAETARDQNIPDVLFTRFLWRFKK